jgi:hypothetical protein
LLAVAFALLVGGTALADEVVMLQPRDDQRTPRVDDRGNRTAEEVVLIRFPDRPVTRRLSLRLIGMREVDLFLLWPFRTSVLYLVPAG